MTHLLEYAIDPTLHMAMPAEGVRVVPHLHGGEVESQSDGGPGSWFTQNFAEKGINWKTETYTPIIRTQPRCGITTTPSV
jgi:hypothetical protein